MIVNAAQHPMGDDRLYITDDGVIMLDGASSFEPVPVNTSDYVDALSDYLTDHLDPETDLRATLRDAISATTADLDLRPGHSPSSTVTIFRRTGNYAECLILGDNLVAMPGRTIIDDRMSEFGSHLRTRYKQRLTDGHGWDGWHTQILRQIQVEQAQHRNKPGGYWIAEAAPEAADHAIVIRAPVSTVPWAVLATDGAYKVMTHLGLDTWADLREATRLELERLLRDCHSWEDSEDPRGQHLPRAKPHDDKSLAVVKLQ